MRPGLGDGEPVGELAGGDGVAGFLLVGEGGHAGAEQQLPGRDGPQLARAGQASGLRQQAQPCGSMLGSPQ